MLNCSVVLFFIASQQVVATLISLIKKGKAAMKKIILVMLILVLAPIAIAQGEYLYKERIYVFSIDYDSGVPAQEECVAALKGIKTRLQVTGIESSDGTRFKIDSVITTASEGLVTNMADEEIGDILICEDYTTYPPEANLVPIYYEISIDGTKYRVEGGGLSPDFPDQLPGGYVQYSPPGYPTTLSRIGNVNGTVLPSIPGKRGGSYAETFRGAPFPEGSGGLVGGSSLVVLRVVLPVSS
jgi:hypothetical protein